MMPFFTYYGGKNRAARHYPAPAHDLIVEPFAGSAGYATNHPDRQVLLRDTDPNIVGTWDYLIHASEREVLALPDVREGETVDVVTGPPEARLLVGWWLNKGAERPRRTPSTFMLRYPEGGPYWGPRVRERIARQQARIRHWRVDLGSFETSPDVAATWFVDPPYQVQGHRYRHGSRGVDYDALATWCRSRSGQVVVCEADDAQWLPFRPLVEVDGTEGRQKVRRARMEVVWTGAEQVPV